METFGRALSLLDNPAWNTATVRILAVAGDGGSDALEVLRAVQRLQGRSGSGTWVSVWQDLAEKVDAEGKEAEKFGYVVTARAAYFRAANYYRQAEFFAAFGTAEQKRLYSSCRRAFHRGASLSPDKVARIAVPYEDGALEGYLCLPHARARGERRPVVVLLGGADSLAEELFFSATDLASRGIYCMVVDTPGRGAALRLRGMTTRPDYEVPGSAVYDWIVRQPELDESKVGLWGVSLGGYYAPRVAARTGWVKALCCSCGCFNVATDIYDHSEGLRPVLSRIVGSKSAAETREKLLNYDLSAVVGGIDCPTLIVHAEGDETISFDGARRLAEEIGDNAELLIHSIADGGTEHSSWSFHSYFRNVEADWLVKQLTLL